MSIFQLDQNIDDRQVVEACAAEGHGNALRLPASLKDAQDPELLSTVMAGPNPFVTLDRRLPWDHTAHIPERNPGIVVVTNYPRKFPTMTSRIALRILQGLKSAFPGWHQVPLNNSVLEVTAEGVAVFHVRRGVLVSDGYSEYTGEDWPDGLREILFRNGGHALPGTEVGKPLLPPPPAPESSTEDAGA